LGREIKKNFERPQCRLQGSKRGKRKKRGSRGESRCWEKGDHHISCPAPFLNTPNRLKRTGNIGGGYFPNFEGDESGRTPLEGESLPEGDERKAKSRFNMGITLFAEKENERIKASKEPLFFPNVHTLKGEGEVEDKDENRKRTLSEKEGERKARGPVPKKK